MLLSAVLNASTIDKRTIGYRVDEIDVEIENAYENFFIDESDVMALVMKMRVFHLGRSVWKSEPQKS